MTADRLVATLLLLQARGKVTAREVADELEVSVRTARRALESLSVAGVPVYSTAGRGGGWALIGGARTDLTGLTADEVRSLFAAVGPLRAETASGRTALRKLVQAVPEPFRAEAEAASEAVLVDTAGWGHSVELGEPEHVDTIQSAIVGAEQIVIDYERPGHPVRARTVEPLGLVTKRGIWYLVAVAGADRRTYRVDRIRGVTRTGQAAARPADFDLEVAWREIDAEVSDRWMNAYLVRAIATPDIAAALAFTFGPAISFHGDTEDGRHHIEVRVGSVEEAVGRLCGFGRKVEVTDPPAVRARLVEVAREVIEQYSR
jgi:predicted DNA-binding transcriptional regulator YafY